MKYFYKSLNEPGVTRNSPPPVSNVFVPNEFEIWLARRWARNLQSLSLTLSLSLCRHNVLVGRFPFDVTVCACLFLSVQPIEYVDTHT